jgi:dihydrofolate synthase/folylpolyglutamate synthase
VTTSNSGNEPDVWSAFSERLFDQNKFAIKLGLENMRVAFAAEGDPQCSAPAIVVGGTNGKGGTCSALVAILQAHGLRTGFYSSPHLIEVRERFRVDGRPVSRELALEHGQHVLETWGNPEASDPCLTFFELTTLMAARIFADAGVDVAIWEVGLGGRLDAVNAIEPELTIVTSIGYDHQQYLGDTIEQIAGEKAALFRAGTPSFIGRQAFSAARDVLTATAPHAVVVEPEGNDVTRWNHELATQAARRFLQNRGQAFDADVARDAVERLTWWGRRDDRRVEGTRFLIDAAHNAQGADSFFDWLAGRDEQPGAFVFAAMRDKDLSALLSGVPQNVPVVHAAVASERAAGRSDVERALGRSVVPANSTKEAVELAANRANGKPVAIFGSLYLLGEAYAALGFDADDFVVGAEPEI